MPSASLLFPSGTFFHPAPGSIGEKPDHLGDMQEAVLKDRPDKLGIPVGQHKPGRSLCPPLLRQSGLIRFGLTWHSQHIIAYT